MSEYLYRKAGLFEFLSYKDPELEQEITALAPDYILNASEEDLINHLVSKYTLEPPSVKVHIKAIIESRPIQVQRGSGWGDGRTYHASGQLIVLAIPFDGDPDLFFYQPSRWIARIVSASVCEGELQLQYEDCDNDGRRLQNAIDNDISYLTNNTHWVQHDINAYHQQLTPRVRKLVSTGSNSFSSS